jgi:hypothetical protein
MNAAKHFGSIIKDEVEKKMEESGSNRFSAEVLKNRITEVLTSIEIETELFVKILC